MRLKKRKLAVVLLVAAMAAVLGFQGYALSVGRATESGRPPRLFGNRPATIAARPTPQSDEKPFTFAVAGDVHSHGTFETLMEKANVEKPDFVVLLGDLVQTPSVIKHKYFQMKMKGVFSDSLPVFALAGNHDIDPESFSWNKFSNLYGDPFFRFSFRKNYFVFCPILPGTGESAGTTRLEQMLAARPAETRRTFVFMPIPPALSNQYGCRGLRTQARIEELFEKYGVDTVFAGDYHGLIQLRRRGVKYIITGGGRGPPEAAGRPRGLLPHRPVHREPGMDQPANRRHSPKRKDRRPDRVLPGPAPLPRPARASGPLRSCRSYPGSHDRFRDVAPVSSSPNAQPQPHRR